MTLAVLIISVIGFAQDQTVEMFGKIFDKDMKPIANVKVKLKGTKFRTLTNGDGSYFFKLPSKKGILVYSHKKYRTKETEFTGTPQASDLILEEEESKIK